MATRFFAASTDKTQRWLFFESKRAFSSFPSENINYTVWNLNKIFHFREKDVFSSNCAYNSRMVSNFAFYPLIWSLLNILVLFQHRLKSSQREKAREFAALTQTGEKTALFCLAHHDWKLDLALDSYFANPELYYKEPKVSVDRKKLETLYSKYKGKFFEIECLHLLLLGRRRGMGWQYLK